MSRVDTLSAELETFLGEEKGLIPLTAQTDRTIGAHPEVVLTQHRRLGLGEFGRQRGEDSINLRHALSIPNPPLPGTGASPMD
jgi:hypothetical protein